MATRDGTVSLGVEQSDLLAQGQPPSGQAGQGELGRPQRRGDLAGAQVGRFGHPLPFFQAEELGPQGLGGGVYH